MAEVIETVKSILITTPERWKQLAENVPADLLELSPAEGEWSARQCLQHLVDTEKVFFFRLGAFRRGEDFPAFNPDAEGSTGQIEHSVSELAAEFSRRRAVSLAALAEIGEKDLPLQARHQELGPVTLEEMLNEWAGHDLNHTVQAERAIMQPFIHACGPWQVYFQDQVIVKK